MTDITLEEGIKAVKRGNFERARRLFNQVVEEDPDSDQGWYWLGLIATDQDKKIACFLRTLDINPDNQAAREKLVRLGVPLPERPDKPGSGSNGFQPDDEDTGPLPTAPAQNQAGIFGRPSRKPEIFQPLEEENGQEDELPAAKAAETHSAAVLEPDLFQTRTYQDDSLSDLYDEDPELLPAARQQSSMVGRLLPVLVILLLVACASLIYLGSQAGGLPFGLALARASATPSPTATRPAPTLTPTRTPLPTSTATPIPPTPTLTPTLSALDSLTRLEALFEQAQNDETVSAWTQAIDAAPDYAGAYYGRARSYLAQATQAQELPQNAPELLEFALDDLNQAILTGPPRAAYYQARYEVLEWLADLESIRTRRHLLLEQMLADVRIAASYGLITPFEGPNPGGVLLRLGRCSEALDYYEQQLVANPSAVTPAGLYTDLARIYLCYGQPRGASVYADRAISLEATPEREWIKAVTSYNLGRYNETLTILNELLEANPDVPADRYFLRALVHLQRREYELAQTDLDLGSQRSLDLGQLAAYASALLARQAGDQDRAEDFLILAEETLSLQYGLVLDRVRRELDLPPLDREIPRLPRTISDYLEDLPESSQPPSPLVETDEILLPVRYDGSGPFHLPPAGRMGMHLYPPVPLEILFVDSLTLRLSPSPQADLDMVEGALWDFSQGRWVPTRLVGGDNPISEPFRYVNPHGDIYFRLENLASTTQAFDNLNLTLAIAGQQQTAQP